MVDEFNLLLYSIKHLNPLQLETLQKIVADYQSAKHKIIIPIDKDYFITATLQLEGVSTKSLGYEEIQTRLASVNEAEMSFVAMFIRSILKGQNLPDGSSVSVSNRGGVRSESVMVPITNTHIASPDPKLIDFSTKLAEYIKVTLPIHSSDQEKKNKAFELLNTAIDFFDREDFPAFNLRILRESFLMQQWDARRLISVYIEELAYHRHRHDLIGQLDTLLNLLTLTLRSNHRHLAKIYYQEIQNSFDSLTAESVKLTAKATKQSPRFVGELLKQRFATFEQIRQRHPDV